MNWAKGLFRIWLICSVIWFPAIGYFACKVFWAPIPFFGNYQNNVQIREMPWKTDWTKPYYEIAYPPGKGKFSGEF